MSEFCDPANQMLYDAARREIAGKQGAPVERDPPDIVERELGRDRLPNGISTRPILEVIFCNEKHSITAAYYSDGMTDGVRIAIDRFRWTASFDLTPGEAREFAKMIVAAADTAEAGSS